MKLDYKNSNEPIYEIWNDDAKKSFYINSVYEETNVWHLSFIFGMEIREFITFMSEKFNVSFYYHGDSDDYSWWFNYEEDAIKFLNFIEGYTQQHWNIIKSNNCRDKMKPIFDEYFDSWKVMDKLSV